MRIAITADPEIPVPPILYGGIERIIFMLVNELVNMGHKVVLFAHKDSVVPCQLIAYNSNGTGIKSALANGITINKALLSQKFDVVHSFGRLGYLVPQMPLAIPKLMSYQREPTISQIKKAVKLSQKGSLAFTGCSNYITNKIKPFAKADTVYNGVDISKYNATSTIAADAPLIFLGRIEFIKGTHTAIEIARKANKKLIIAGNIPSNEQTYFNEKIKPFLNKDIIYTGPVNDQQKNELLGNALALLMPIHWDEPFGIVMIEAMACGTPVIGFNRGAVPEVIVDGINGYIVADADDAVTKVSRLSSINRDTVRQHVEDKFSFDVIARQYLSLYERF